MENDLSSSSDKVDVSQIIQNIPADLSDNDLIDPTKHIIKSTKVTKELIIKVDELTKSVAHLSKIINRLLLQNKQTTIPHIYSNNNIANSITNNNENEMDGEETGNMGGGGVIQLNMFETPRRCNGGGGKMRQMNSNNPVNIFSIRRKPTKTFREWFEQELTPTNFHLQWVFENGFIEGCLRILREFIRRTINELPMYAFEKDKNQHTVYIYICSPSPSNVVNNNNLYNLASTNINMTTTTISSPTGKWEKMKYDECNSDGYYFIEHLKSLILNLFVKWQQTNSEFINNHYELVTQYNNYSMACNARGQEIADIKLYKEIKRGIFEFIKE